VPRFKRLEFPDDRGRSEKPHEDNAQGKPPKRYKTSVEDWMRDADKHRRRGDYELAMRSYGRALEMERSHVSAWLGQVQMLIMLNEPRQAELWAVSGLKIFPGNADLLAAQAQAMCRLGKDREAMQFSDASLQGEGNSAYRWSVRGELLLSQKSSTATHCFDNAEKFDGDWLVKVENANILRCYNANLYAVQRATAAVQAAMDSPLAWMTKGICELETGLVTEAKTSLNRALELDKNYIEARDWLAKIENNRYFFRRILGFFRRR
jgi:tetratricopeptide (TPR) repeat protein